MPVSMSLAEAGDMGPTARKEHAQRDAVLAAMGCKNVHLVEQIHSRKIVSCDAVANNSERLQADGIWGKAGQTAAVTVADCMPIAVFEHGSGLWALLHSGRKGTGILRDALELLLAESRKAENAHGVAQQIFSVLLGPCIQGRNYPVDFVCAEEFAQEWGRNCLCTAGEGLGIDLRQANLNILESFGVQDVYIYDDCTYEHNELSSYRAEGSAFRRMLVCLNASGDE